MRISAFFCYVTIFCFSYTTVKSQEADAILYEAHYLQKHVGNKKLPTDTLKEDMVLLIGERSMLFTSYDKLVYGHEVEQGILLAHANSEPGKPFHYDPPTGKFLTMDDLYFFTDVQQHYVLDFLMDRYLFPRPYTQPEWTISSEQKDVMGMACQQATATYRGREWTAWFTPEIPTTEGPWQLRGLPGLVVEAYDKTGEVSFELTSLQSVSGDSANALDSLVKSYTAGVIALPTDKAIKKAKESDFLKLKQAAQADFTAYINTRRITNGFMDNFYSNSWSWKGAYVTNPIALTD